MGDRKLDSLFRRYVRRDDVAALGRVFDLAAPELMRVARHLCRDEAVAEDVVQATFETALQKRAEFAGRPPGHPGHPRPPRPPRPPGGVGDRPRRVLPWMLGILARHARKARRQEARQPDPQLLADRAPPDPADVAADREFDVLVDRAVAGLPPRYATVVGSYLRLDRRPAQIATELGITPNAASVRLHRGLKMLRKALPASAAPALAGAVLGGHTTTGPSATGPFDPASIAREGAAAHAAGLSRGRGLQAVRARVLEAASAQAGGGSAAASLAATSLTTTLGGLLVHKPILSLVAAAAVAGGGVYALTPKQHPREVRALREQVASLTAELERARNDLQLASRTAPQGGAVLVDPASTRTSAPESDPDETVAAAAAPITPEQWLARFREADGWREGLAVGYEIAALDPDEALAVMRAIYHDIPDFQHRQQVLKPFVFHGGHVHALEILHLAATDSHLGVRDWAWGYLEDYAFQDFSEDFQVYEQWRARFAEMSLGEVLATNARELVTRVAGMSDAELLEQFEDLERLDLRAGKVGGVDLPAVLREAGLLSAIQRWLVSGNAAVARGALAWLPDLEPDETFLRHSVLPLIDDPDVDRELRGRALGLLGDPDHPWAFDPLLDQLVRTVTQTTEPPFDVADALGDLGDARAIPTMIGLIAADDTYRTRYGIGYFGLGKLTGIDYDEDHDAAFWLDWWERNRSSLPAEVGALKVPTFTVPR